MTADEHPIFEKIIEKRFTMLLIETWQLWTSFHRIFPLKRLPVALTLKLLPANHIIMSQVQSFLPGF